jgi:arylsulfatase A-like enzyme
MMRPVNRRSFLKHLAGSTAALAFAPGCLAAAERPAKGPAAGSDYPNVILAMTDDQGWGDTGYNGHPALKTPALDAMARSGLRFNRFYSGAPVCSPTRGSAMTGRHPYRYGIFFANVGHMRPQEVTLAEALKSQGYTTGHFGKWHLGTLTKTEKDSNRGGPGGAAHYAPPWENGFDVCFSTEAKVPTWNPMKKPGSDKPYGTSYWTGPEEKAAENLAGDDSRVIMDRALPFIRDAAARGTPFLAVIWFHTPHEPVVAGQKYLSMYAGVGNEKERHYYGCLTAMDEQMGRLRAELRRLGVAHDTMLWFCADNGPEHRKGPGSTGGLRGRKRDLFEGGIRVPGLLEWPARLTQPRATSVPCSTSDYFPTVLSALGFHVDGKPEPADGVDLMPLIDGRMTERPRPIAFESGKQMALVDNRWKLLSTDKGASWMLFDLSADPAEANDVAVDHPDVVTRMTQVLEAWRASCRDSLAGEDYG